MNDVGVWFFSVCAALTVSIFAAIGLIALAGRRPKIGDEHDWFV